MAISLKTYTIELHNDGFTVLTIESDNEKQAIRDFEAVRTGRILPDYREKQLIDCKVILLANWRAVKKEDMSSMGLNRYAALPVKE